MRSTYKLFSLTACAALLISISSLALAGCRDTNIPVSVPSVPPSSSSQPVSSSSSSSMESSETTTSSEVSSSSKPTSSSKPASSTKSSGSESGSGTGTSAYSGKTYSKAVTDSKKETFKSVKITASGVYLSNKTITGDLIIDKGVADGKVTLENVSVGNIIYVYGGGENSIYLKSVKAAKLISASTVSRPRIVAQYNTNIGKTEVRYDTVLENDGLYYDANGFNKIETVKTSQSLTVLKLLNIGVYSLIISDDTNLFLKGSSSVSYLTANSPAYIEGASAIGTLECNSRNITVDYSPGYITSKSDSYYYAPKIINDDGDSSSSSSITGTLSAPTLRGSITNVYWGKVSGAELGYEMRVNLKGATFFTSLYFSSTEDRSLNLQEFLTDQGADSGTYQVRVRACATASKNESAFSNVLTFKFSGSTTMPTVSDLNFSGTDRTKYILSWAAANANGYNVTVTNSSKAVKLNKEITTSSAKSIDLRAAMGTANFAAGDYTVVVTAKSAFKQASATSHFTVSVAPTPSGFSYEATTKTVTWFGSSTASYYKSGKTGVSETTVGNQYILGDATYPIGATYTVSVKQIGSVGNELDSAVATYVVNKAASAAAASSSSVTLTRSDTNKITLSWSAVPGASDYVVTLSKDASAVQSNIVVTGTTYGFDFHTIPSLSTGGTTTYSAAVITRAAGLSDSAPALSNSLIVTADDLKFDAGRGTKASPYEVKNATQFNNISLLATLGKYFIQKADISTDIVAAIPSFSGTYDGGNKTIKVNINAGSNSQNVGLFGILTSEATAKNIIIAESSLVVGSSNVGFIAGENNGTIDMCKVNTTNSSVTGSYNVGGICGNNKLTISNCNYAGHLLTLGSPAVEVTDKTASFGLIAGVSTGNTSTGNTSVDCPYPAIGIVGDPAAVGGDGGITSPEGVAVPDSMARRLLPWLSFLSGIL